MWKEILGEYVVPTVLPLLITVASVFVTMAIAYLKRWSKRLMDKWEATDAEQSAVQALFQGVEHAQEAIVVDLKRGAVDGKLTKDERAQALSLAIDHAKKVAKGPGLDLLKTWSRERMGGIVKQILAKISKKK